jgi:hypothetical protein
MTAVPLFPSLVAVIIAVPGPTGVTKPLVLLTKPVALTVATVGSLLDHRTA